MGVPVSRKIRVLTPAVSDRYELREPLQALACGDTEISVAFLAQGPTSIENEFDHAMSLPGTLRGIVEAERDGMDAVVINCMGDPGVHAGRELVTIPVVGPSQAAMHVAAMLGHRFSIVTVLESVVPMLENEVRLHGLSEKFVSTRWVNIPVLELEQDPARMLRALVDECEQAITRDGAHVIVLGCTGMFGCVEFVERGLVERGLQGIPIVDPVPVALRMAESLVDLKLRHSRRTYPAPRAKPLHGYDLPAPRPR
jgi:allantoin racemase